MTLMLTIKQILGTVLVFALLGVVLVLVTACSSATPGAQDIKGCSTEWDAASGCPVTIQYEGRDLHCVSWSGSHGEVGLTCDFVRFHAEGNE